MAETVEMVRVYRVDWTFSAVAFNDPDFREDESWVYGDWGLAAARAKRCFDATPKGDVVISTDLMTRPAFEALEPDEDPL